MGTKRKGENQGSLFDIELDELRAAMNALADESAEVNDIASAFDSGLVGSPFAHEAMLCTNHLRRVGQPVTVAAFRLWIDRRWSHPPKCPVGPKCGKVASGLVFCLVHATYEAT